VGQASGSTALHAGTLVQPGLGTKSHLALSRGKLNATVPSHGIGSCSGFSMLDHFRQVTTGGGDGGCARLGDSTTGPGGDLMAGRPRKSRWFFVHHGVVAGALVVGGVLCVASAPASAAGMLHVSVATGLVQKQIVTVTGSGLADHAFGNVLECNGTPGEPTVSVGPPFDQSIPVGCSAPSLKHIVSTTPTGVLSTTFQVRESQKLGPPCGLSPVLGSCGRTDSSGKHPRADAKNYPCPPTSAQVAASVTCSLVFYDSAHDVVSAPIRFG
jgi:hypothetical protein